MSAFLPTFCPRPSCAAHHPGASFRFQRSGSYRRANDGRRVQRFRCLCCLRRFSAQSFRLDFRQHKPRVNVPLLGCLVSKVSHRQTARILRIDRKTVHRRLRLWGPALRRWHEAFLDRATRAGGLHGSFSFDELETFEGDRRLRPLTVPVLIHRRSRFLISFAIGELPARGGLAPRDRARKECAERTRGRRRSGSKAAVERCLLQLRDVHAPEVPVELVTDRKKSYPPLVRKHFPRRGAFVRESSTAVRNTRNPLFPINHTLAMMRDHISRLVRRSWCVSKRGAELDHHLWIWTAWRNYVRPRFNRTPRQSPASFLGLAKRRFRPVEILRWIWPARSAVLAI